VFFGIIPSPALLKFSLTSSALQNFYLSNSDEYLIRPLIMMQFDTTEAEMWGKK